MTRLADRLRAAGIGEVEEGADLSRHTSYRIGGPAAVLAQPSDLDSLRTVLRLAHQSETPVAVIGWGSNLIVADEGFDGLVIKLAEAFRYVRIEGEEGSQADRVQVVVGAATMNNHLVRELLRRGLSGVEFLALVPGTFGGAVAMNAGTKRGEVGDIVDAVRLVTPAGRLCELSAEALAFRYRHADLPAGAVIVEGTIGARRGGVDEGQELVRDERAYRNRTQPYHHPSAGSVFENPPSDYAGRLLEAAGLKGQRRGGAQISELHANFIVTEPGARAADVLALMALARREVRARFGVVLEPEQRLLGFGETRLGELLDRLGEQAP